MTIKNIKSEWMALLASGLFVILVTGLVFSITDKNNDDCREVYRYDIAISTALGESLEAEKVDTPEERTRGLSGRECIPGDKAMLFDFESDGYHGIWMKDMNFSIDIIWLDSNKKVVHIERDVSPETYPDETFRPTTSSRYVLELANGSADRLNIDIGTTLSY